jgi:UDP-N-acetylglucosamine 2-epimerase (non-hydrolysing)
MKIVIVVGARPNFMKAAPIIHAIEAHNASLVRAHDARASRGAFQFVLVHTGQHYDKAMSDNFFTDLNLPAPSVHLGVGSGSHAAQTAEIMKQFESVLVKEEPDAVLVVGDVNSTLACALVTAKIALGAEEKRPLIAHVEAGLRSNDRTMPEEINRILVDQLSDFLFVTEQSGVENLCREGVSAEKIHFVGNTMIDSLLKYKDKADSSTVLDGLALRDLSLQSGSANGVLRYALLTMHRASNVDHRETFLNILQGIEELAKSCPIIFPVHPRTRARIREFGLDRYFLPPVETQNSGEPQMQAQPGIHLTEPLGYVDFLCLMKNASLVVTDSGGIQEETTCLGVPCVTVRENTERPITVTCGTNRIAGTSFIGIRDSIRQHLTTHGAARAVPEKWDGRAGQRIVEILDLHGRMKEVSGLSKGLELLTPTPVLFPVPSAGAPTGTAMTASGT